MKFGDGSFAGVSECSGGLEFRGEEMKQNLAFIALGVIVWIIGPGGMKGLILAFCVGVVAAVFLQALENRD